MSRTFDRVNSLVQVWGLRVVKRSLGDFHAHHAALRRLTDEALQELCRKALEGFDISTGVSAPRGLAAFNRVLGAWLNEATIDDVTIRRIALAAAVFERAPADLPADSVLYEQQIQAAVALTQRSLVQMDTGEGKTYAILPAGFALCCRYNRIYILCPSDYLAQRDAARTRRFWQFLGLESGVALLGEDEANWNRRVIYTTLEAMMFHHLGNEIGARPSTSPITFGAAILDEADAILLDDANQPFVWSASVPSAVFDWERTAELASGLEEGTDITVDRAELSAALTLAGQRKLEASPDYGLLPPDRRLVFRDAVERSYIANCVVIRDRDYVVEGSYAHALDQATGAVLRRQNLGWLMPLEHKLGLGQRPGTITLHSIQPRVLLRYFHQLSGLSGTIEVDSREYLAAYRLPCVVIDPIHPREDGEKEGDIIFRSREYAHRHALERVREAVETGRPVLVGTQSIPDARDFHALLVASDIDANFQLITGGMEPGEMARVLERAGHPGSVVVGTQVAGRGIDIRLTEEARSAGGLFLVALGHAMDQRLDRQFLGRGGRQGDPWSRVYICHLGDEVFRTLGGKFIEGMLAKSGAEDDEQIAIGMIDRSLRLAQGLHAQSNFNARRRAEPIEATARELRSNIRRWFEHVQAFGEALERSTEEPDAFLGWLVKQYIELNLREDLEKAAMPSMAAAQGLADKVAALYARSGKPCSLNPLVLVGKSAADMETIIIDHLRKDVCAIVAKAQAHASAAPVIAQNYHKALADLPGRIDAAFEAAAAAQSLQGGGSGRALAKREDGMASSLDRGTEDMSAIEAQIKTLVPEIHLKLRDVAAGSSQAVKLRAAHADLEPLRVDIAQLREINDQMPRLAQRVHRSPLGIANRALRLGWCGFLDREDGISHQTRHERLSTFDYPRVLKSRLMTEWAAFEKEMRQELLVNLLTAERPERLDEQFALLDGTQEHRPPPDADRLRLAEPDPEDARRQINAEVAQFLGVPSRRLFELGGREDQEALMRLFLVHAPLHRLRSPTQIEDALSRWGDLEERLRVPARYRKQHKDWIGRFLIALNARGRFGPVPRQASPSLFSRFASLNFRELESGSLIMVGALLLIASSFPLLSLIQLGGGPTFDGALELIGKLVFGGLLSRGAFTAPTAAALVAAAVFTGVFFANRPEGNKGVMPLERWVAWGAAAIAAAAIGFHSTQTHAIDYLLTFLFILASIYCAIVLSGAAWWIDNRLGVNVLLLGVSISSALLLWHDVLLDRWALGPALVCLLLFAGFLVVRLTNVAHIDVIAVRITNIQMEAKLVESTLKIRPNVGIRAHLFGLVAALSTYGLTNALTDRDLLLSDFRIAPDLISSVATYVFSICLFARHAIGRQFSVREWERQLNQRRQYVKGHETGQELRAFLSAWRRRIVWREIASYVAIGAVAAVGLRAQRAANIEAGLVALVCCSILAEAGSTFVRQVLSVRDGGAGAYIDGIEFKASAADIEPDGKRQGLRWLRPILERPGLVISTLASLATVTRFVVEYWPIIRRWFAPA